MVEHKTENVFMKWTKKNNLRISECDTTEADQSDNEIENWKENQIHM